jgi:antagonist of KipI
VSVRVLGAGLLTTLQDGGRHGYAAIGVGAAGAMDDVARRLANILVNNIENAATLELTLRGPRLGFAADTLIAITGADVEAHCGDIAIPTWRPVLLRAGAELMLGGMRHGVCAYVAVAGGIGLEPVLDSCSTDVNARIGPIPRPLAVGDALPASAAPAALCPDLWRKLRSDSRTTSAFASWSLDPTPWFDGSGAKPVHAIAGTHFNALDSDSQRALFGASFRVGVDSNRVGFRLQNVALNLREPLELVTEGTAPGTLQLPPGGVPIALMAEAPPTGGYPRIAHVIAVDQPRLAQRRPGDAVRFAQTDLADARMRYLERERAIAQLSAAVRARLYRPY